MINQPLHFCTVFDRKYLLKGLCLYRCLHKQLIGMPAIERPFILHILCLDQETFDVLKALKFKNVYLYPLSALEAVDPKLRAAKTLPASKYGSQADNYIWRLTPYFINHILKSIEPDQYLMYVDSDICFYKSPAIIIDAVKSSGKSMGIHTHRFGGPFKKTMDVGWFNVGVVLFKNDHIGQRLALWWKGLTLTNDHDRYQEYGTCGDQKYFDLIYEVDKDNICVFDEQFDIYHLAPWNDWLDKELHFYHFSHFKEDLLSSDGWKDSFNGEWFPTKDDRIKALYHEYNLLNQAAALSIPETFL